MTPFLSLLTVLPLALLLPHVADAREMTAMAGAPAQNCEFKETATISLTLNGVGESPEKISSITEAKVAELTAIAKAAGATAFSLQNKNYSLNPMNNQTGGMGGYNYSLSYAFLIEPGSLANAVLSAATAKGINAGLNVNAYRQCQ